MGVYHTLVCHTCKKNYDAYKNKQLALYELAKHHVGHDTEMACDGEIRGEYLGLLGGKYQPAIYVPSEYKEIDLTKEECK